MPIGHDMRDAILNTAIKSPDHLIRFLKTSGREFFVMDSEDLIRSLPTTHWDEGVLLVQNIVSMYRDHRRTQETGLVEVATVKDPDSGLARTVEVPVMKDETLEPEELDKLIEWAQARKAEALARRAQLTLKP